MKLDPKGLALAVAIVTAVLWILCSVFVSIAPGPAMGITGHMVHADLSEFTWSLSWGGVLVGLVSWTLAAAVPAWLIAWTYNRLVSPKSP